MHSTVADDEQTRLCAIVHRRFMELAQSMERLPPVIQTALIANLWRDTLDLISGGESQNPALKVSILRFLHTFLDAFEQLVNSECAAVPEDEEMCRLGYPKLARMFQEHRAGIFRR